jgi:chromosome segregation and condensation protein ScpB
MKRGRCCHYCGQPLPEHRLGVSLAPKQGHIFDLVCRAGGDGISRCDLADIVGCEKSTIATHIYYINEKLRDRGYHIKGYGTYRLIQWGNASAPVTPKD